MRVAVEYIKRVPCVLKKSFIVNIIKSTLKISGYDFLQGKKVSVNVVFVDAEEIQKLNKTYRRKNKVTDVLSFPEYANKKEIEEDASDSIVLGDLIVCYDYIIQAAIEDDVTLEREMAYIVSHGVLHLLGFRHSEKMFALQDIVSEKCHIKI